MLLAPALFVLDRTGVIKRGVHAAAVIPAQPFKHRVLGFPDRGEALSMQPFYLQRTEPCFAASVVPAVPLAAHRCRNTVLVEKPREVMTGILTAAIAMK